MYTFYEFFAGGGMVRAGLGKEWRCLFANDFDHKKSRVYTENWGIVPEIRTSDVGSIESSELPVQAKLAWASFPCQDLSLAGAGAGLRGERSGTFWPFWTLMKTLVKEDRAPALIVLENVSGTLNSHDGKDFATICAAFCDAGYLVGAMIIDASLFVPQSRPRLFIIGVDSRVDIPRDLVTSEASARWHTKTLKSAYQKLPSKTKDDWLWWNLPTPRARRASFSSIIEETPTGTEWFSAEETRQLLAMMSDINRAKLIKAKKLGRRIVGGVYKRTRLNEDGEKVQRAEIRFDDISGCLRTPAGGSSRQVILVVDGQSVKARLISTRETARLMGLPDSYKLPQNYNEAYHLTGDGVVVPVVNHLAKHIFERILSYTKAQTTAA
jgi:DNA (cytosine-5)-methyltransferase 1